MRMKYETVINRYEKLMWSIVYGIVKQSGMPMDVSEDIMQEVKIAIYNKLPEYDSNRASIKTFVANITKNTTKKYRHKYYDIHYMEQSDIEDIPSMEDAVEILQRTMLELGMVGEEADMFNYSLQGYTQTEIGEKFGYTQQKVSEILRDYKRKVLQELRKCGIL